MQELWQHHAQNRYQLQGYRIDYDASFIEYGIHIMRAQSETDTKIVIAWIE